ncbi:hypothetical protein P43SY_007555 [Pythium insidiosum]|uniref:Transmembrane protein n=1 Tax=Pythium insidiosum TaxID=114742 RepID=A0AAD5LVE1_PYTIN|nr:hypothetical protein P43SY_007555 [Pythium insidiosum]
MAAPSPSKPVMEQLSPAGAFVSVMTPTDQGTAPVTEDVDINGIRVGAWSSELRTPADLHTGYFWMVTCCPCVPVAQLEVRLGRAPSYARALLSHGLSYALFIGLLLASICTFFCGVLPGTSSVSLFLLLLLCFALSALLVARRIARLRSEVRERFQIPGSIQDDQRVALVHTSRAIRQMGKHLQCDRAVFASAPATLQAYQV